jgi:hypothetical protein
MVDEIDLSELLRAVEQVREIYRTPLPRPSRAWPAQTNGREYCDAERPLESGE